MKEDKMENIHLIFKFLWYSVLFCIWGVSCTAFETSLPLKKEFINEETWKHYLILS